MATLFQNLSRPILSFNLFTALIHPHPSIEFQDRPATQGKVPAELNVTKEMRSQDVRLELPVTLDKRGIYLAEALDEITRQTGVRCSASERDGAADEAIIIVADRTPLIKVLNGLWAAMSYRDAQWEWSRSGEAGAYKYTLQQPESARRFRQRQREEVERKLERDVIKLIASLDKPEKEKDRAVKEIYGEPEQGFQKFYTFSKDRLWADVRSFRDALSPDQRKSVLSGRQSFDVPLSSLNESSRSFYLRANADLAVGSVSGPNSSEPTTIHFGLRRYYSTPAVEISVPNATSPYPVIGGIPIQRSFWARMKASWMLDSDASEDPAENVVIVRPEKIENEPRPARDPLAETDSSVSDNSLTAEPRNDAIARRLEGLALGAHVTLVARLPQEPAMYWLNEPWNSTMRDYWKTLWNKELMYKWRDGVLVMSTIGWPLEDPPVPLRFLRTLRQHAKPGELLPFEDIIAAADLLTRNQLIRLKREFPVMNAVAQARELLSLFFRYPAMAKQAQTPSGLPLTPMVVEALQTILPPELMDYVSSGTAKSLAVTIRSSELAGASSREVVFYLKDKTGANLKGYGFVDRPQPKPILKR